MRRINSYLICGLLLVSGLPAQSRNQPEIDLQAAIRTETVNGDLKKAINQYEAIVAKYANDRTVVARALVHMAECHQKLGDAESRRIYERVVREYADQREEAAEARSKLGTGDAITTQLITSVRDNIKLWSLDTEGRYATGEDKWNGDLIIRDMTTGAIRRISPEGGDGHSSAQGVPGGRHIGFPVLSPDQKQMAFCWWDDSKNPHQGQLWVISTDPGSKPRLLNNDSHFGEIFPLAFSSDRKSLLVGIVRKNDSGYLIAWLSLVDGSTKTLKESTHWIQDATRLSPDGKYIAYTEQQQDENLFHIRLLASDGSSDTALVTTSGYNGNPVWAADGEHILFLSSQTGTYDLWRIPIRNGKAAGGAVLVKRNFAHAYIVGMTRSGSLFYYSDNNPLGSIAVVGMKPVPRIEDTLIGYDPALSPDGKLIAFVRVLPGSQYGRVLVVRWRDSGEEKIYPIDSPEGIIAGPTWMRSSKALLITTLDDHRNHGAVYRVEIATAACKQVMEFEARYLAGDLYDISPDEKTLYVAGREVTGGIDNRVIAYDIATKQQKVVFTLGQRKEIHSAIHLSPDGKTLGFHVIDDQSRYVVCVGIDGFGYRELYKDQKASIGGNTWTADGHALLFAHRKANDLWELLSAPAAGGARVAMGLDLPDQFGGFSLSADGSHLAVVATQNSRELSKIDNVLGPGK
jgi:Tol biopolymer transport system component